MKLQIHTCALLLATLGMVGTSFGAGAPAVPESLRNCATKQDVLQRLSCFDAELAKLEGTQAAAPAPAPAPAPAIAAPPAAPTPRPAAATPPQPQPQVPMGSEQLRNAPGVPLGQEQLRKPTKPAASSSLGSSLMFWRSSDKDKAKEKEKEADTGMTARIDSIRKTAMGLYVVTLDNGQVWQQQEFETDFPLDAGETIRIDKGAMGSYRLRPVREGWKRWFRVNRTK